MSKGGDVVFQVGRGTLDGEAEGATLSRLGGSFVFKLADGAEVLRLDSDGAVTVRGERVDYSREVYEGFKRWLSEAGVVFGPGAATVAGGGT